MKKVAKPQKPKKYFFVKDYADYSFSFVSNRVALSSFLDWIKESVPTGAKDVTIGLESDHYYDDGITWIQVEWKEKVKNTRYVSDMKRYEKRLRKWEEQCQK